MKTKIIYEDQYILICYKPAGLATQTSKVGQQDMVSELKIYLAAGKSGQPYLGVIHRLDQPVEGLLVFAKDSKAAAKLSAFLSQGTLNKQYYAVVYGQPAAKEAQLVDYLMKDPATGSAKVVMGTKADKAQKAVLQYRVLMQVEMKNNNPVGEESRMVQSTPASYSLLDIHIDTGRFHQIRAQMAHAGLPLLGDSRYGDDNSMQLSRQLGVRNVALCAYRIDLVHPVTGKKMNFEIEPEAAIFK